ncbi:MAG TPA: hypothetical protein VGK19_20975 [Capsulimonadaceae bacterium]|jgi:hypothetical protein
MYRSLVRQMLDHHGGRGEVMPWGVQVNVNCFQRAEAGALVRIGPAEMFELVQAGWLEAEKRYHRELACSAAEEAREK